MLLYIGGLTVGSGEWKTNFRVQKKVKLEKEKIKRAPALPLEWEMHSK